MSARTLLVGLGLLVGVLPWPGSMAAQSVPGEAGKDTAARPGVVLTLKVADRQSGLTLDLKRSVPRGSNAFEVLRETVAVKYKTFPELGYFVTGLCGVDPPEGMVWTFTVDGRWSDVGIGGLTLERDTVIEWALH